MKLGEALTLRAKQAQRLNDLQGRIKANVLTQEGTGPQEPPAALIDEYVALSEAHGELVGRIARTNAMTTVSSARVTAITLLDLLREREGKQRERNIYRLAADQATPRRDDYRFMRSELKYEPQVDVVAMREQADRVDEEVRTLDAQIQTINWETELLG